MTISVEFPAKVLLVWLLEQLNKLDPETVTTEQLTEILDGVREQL